MLVEEAASLDDHHTTPELQAPYLGMHDLSSLIDLHHQLTSIGVVSGNPLTITV
jgi:hypothetical protein